MGIVYLFFFLITVSLGRCDDECFDLYGTCRDLITERKGSPPCKVANDFMKCMVSATEVCFPSLKDFVVKYQVMVENACQPGSTFIQDTSVTLQCLMKEKDPFKNCQLEGDFNNVAEVCSSANNLIGCIRSRTDALCGKRRGNVLYEVLSPFQDFLEDCQNSEDYKETELDVCYKGLLNCDRHILTRSEYSCPVVERTARCYVDVGEENCDLDEEDMILLKVIRRYVDQIPDYCNLESDIMQNFVKSANCIGTNYAVLESCNENFLPLIFDVGFESKESLITSSKATVEFRDCIEDKLRTACGEEAAFVARYVLDPLATVADETCIQQTKEKCNGANGVMCTTFLFILCIIFILAKDDE